jgi:type III pantothenate kinase
VVVDVGNSRVKWGRVRKGRIVAQSAFPHDNPVGWKRTAQEWKLRREDVWIVAGVHPKQVLRVVDWIRSRTARCHVLDTSSFLKIAPKLGLTLDVEKPERVGIDRLLSATSAMKRTRSNVPLVVITVGTAMTVDFLDGTRRFLGGAILPGPRLMARSLKKHTAKLPLIDLLPALPTNVWGRNTKEAMALGIASAVLGSADQLVWDFAKTLPTPPHVVLTGGDFEYFRGYVFTADVHGITFVPELTLDGLRLAAAALP